MVCSHPAAQPALHITPFFLIGALAVIFGTYIRISCYRALGQHFTFDLTVLPSHRLVTTSFYGYVRHPAYTGLHLVALGTSFMHLTKGSWVTECQVLGLRAGGSAAMVGIAWLVWSVLLSFGRASAEDSAMKKEFGKEWESWATDVPWWFIPGLL